MPFISSKVGVARGLAAAGLFAALVGTSAIVPAFAGDDGQEPIWNGLGDLVGLTGKDKEAPIDYRERPRLVLPPKMVLAPPVPSEAQKTAAWPVDPDLEKIRKEKEAKRTILSSQSDLQEMRDGHRLSPDQLRADRTKPGETHDTKHCAAQTKTRGCEWIPFHNVWENLGLAKSDDIVAGQEPDRDWLTDPPKGFRLPTASTSATFDAKPHVNDADPRTALYHAPDQ